MYVSYLPNQVQAMGRDPSGIGADGAVVPVPSEAVVSDTWKRQAWALASTLSMVASVYHGYRRNNSVGWAIGWGFLGALFPIITPTIAVAQGFGKPKSGMTPNRRRRLRRNRRRR